MPRLANTLPKYRKHRASSQAIVELNGHRHYLGPHGTKASKLEYDRLIAEWLASGRSSTYGAAPLVHHCRGYGEVANAHQLPAGESVCLATRRR